MKLLIIEEEKGSSRSILQYLRRDTYRCDVSLEAEYLSQSPALAAFDCILLNCVHSDDMAFRVLHMLNAQDYPGGVIMLSFQRSPESRVRGLNAGADDYLSQPVHFGELSARIGAIIRRRNFAGNKLLVVKELSIDLAGKLVSVRHNPVDLTRKEFDLLLYLASNPNRVVSKESIATNLAEENEPHQSPDFIYAHVKNLKKKLAAAGCRDCIASVYGMGYKFTT
ncbi:MAG TPA: response regulator transcription factor [Puia sp.]|nr:response regulator transcription factor [Puia sp.]